MKLKDIVEQIPVIEVIGDIDKEIRNVVSAKKGVFDSGDIVWISDANLELIGRMEGVVIVCSEKLVRDKVNESCTYLVVGNPRLYFLKLIKTYFIENEPPYISSRSLIDPTARIGRNVTIHAGVVIEKKCEIGDDTIIGCNTVIRQGTIIGKSVKIGANNTIGGDGFGYERDDNGEFELIPHIGNVLIEDGVEIGNNTAIDKGVLGSTIVRRNAKIDNLVHIAHGVEVGENSLIIANSMIAGSVIIGKNVWIAPSASVLNKISIGDDAIIGLGAVVLRAVKPKQTVVGNPARDISTVRKA